MGDRRTSPARIFERGEKFLIEELNGRRVECDVSKRGYRSVIESKEKKACLDIIVDDGFGGEDERAEMRWLLQVEEHEVTILEVSDKFKWDDPRLEFFTIERWLAGHFFDLNTKSPTDLERVFGVSDLRVCDIWGSDSSFTFEVILRGYSQLKPKRISILVFRDVDKSKDNYRRYSYAILAHANIPQWYVFPFLGSPDSGGALLALQRAEKAIARVGRNIKVVRHRIDCAWDPFILFLSGYAITSDLSHYLDEKIGGKHGTGELYGEIVTNKDVKRVTTSLFKSGHFDQAIFEAYKTLNILAKQRTKISDLDGQSLMARIFDVDRPLLRLNRLKTVSERDEQEGFKLILMGAMRGIRNPRAHEPTRGGSKIQALQYLVFASLLADKINEAEVCPESKDTLSSA